MTNEKRLIDANALKEKIAKEIHTYWTNGAGGYCLAEDVIPDIDNAPHRGCRGSGAWAVGRRARNRYVCA